MCNNNTNDARLANVNVKLSDLICVVNTFVAAHNDDTSVDFFANELLFAVKDADPGTVNLKSVIDDLRALLAGVDGLLVHITVKLCELIADLEAYKLNVELYEILNLRFFGEDKPVGICSFSTAEDEESDDEDEESDDEDEICANCGCIIKGDGVEVDGDLWCEDCAESESFVCDHCGERHDSTDMHNVTSCGYEESWCEDCFNNAVRHGEVFFCEHCETWHEGESREVNCRSGYRRTYETWCEDCVESDAHTCEHCDTTYDDATDECCEWETWDGDFITLCDDCRYDDYVICEDCGNLVRDWDAEDINGDLYCPNCAENHRGYTDTDNISSYHHTRSGLTFWLKNDLSKPDWRLTSDDRKNLFLGIELETDDSDDKGAVADDIISKFGDDRFECKEDGSLSDEGGLEIVSHPMTPEVHLNYGIWEGISEIVRDHDGRSHDAGSSCGLHIHMNRDAFVDHDAVYRLDRLFYRFKTQMVRFSRRTSSQLGWCRIGDDDLAEIKDVVERKKQWEKDKKCANRYEAVNDTNDSTVEIRLWRGTLNIETLRATIEFTTGLAYAVNAISNEFADELDWERLKLIVRYALEENDLPHNDLDAYLERRGL